MAKQTKSKGQWWFALDSARGLNYSLIIYYSPQMWEK